MTEFFGQPPVASGGGRGFVRPRASRQPGGAALPLLKLIEPYLGKRGVIYIVGPAGSGKTWALHYLGATLEKNDRKWLIDQPQERYWELKEMPPLAIVTTLPRKELDAIAVLHLAPWTEDDLIEFLLNGGHRGRVTSVMARLRDGPDRSALAGSPQLWRIVLEEMIADDNVRTCGAALRKRLVGLLDERVRDGLLAMSLAAARAGEPIKVEDLPRFVPEELSRLVRHPIVCRLLAAERIVTDLERFRGERDFHQTLSREVVRETGRLLPERPAALENLQKLLARRDSRADAMGASVMLVVDPFGVHRSGGPWR